MINTKNLIRTILNVYRHDPSRHYHNDRHISEMLDVANAKKIELSTPQLLAILFHDIVYIPGKSDISKGYNEKLSVEFMLNYFYNVYPEGKYNYDLEIASKIILSTIDHIPLIKEAEVVLDLDLERLSRSFEDFYHYTDDIFFEYARILQTPKLQNFIMYRIKFLEDFVKSRKSIYFTDYFKDEELSAKNNIERWIAINKSSIVLQDSYANFRKNAAK